MSRSYRLEVMTRGVPIKDLARIMTARFHWNELDRGEYRGIAYFVGEGCLNCGQPEPEAHQAMSEAIKIEYPAALVATQWTCLEPRPYTIYGDDVSVSDKLLIQTTMKGGAETNNGQDIFAGH